jgi:hypothetical protein
MTKSLAIVVAIFALLTLAGCKQDVDTTKLSPYLYDYAPVNIGHSVTYDVDSIVYNFDPPFQSIDTSYYQIKEVISDTFYDNLGNINYKISVFKRTDTTQPFSTTVYQVWSCVVNKSTYQKVENDLRFIKLVFPPINGVTWNGNSYLPANDTIADVYQPYASWVYTYTSVNASANINRLIFDSTIVVSEVNNQNLVNSELSTATYARHVGLVYKQFELIEKQGIGSPWTAPDSANGFRIKQWIHSYTP